ncbi:MAG: preprotein translocase subunit SecE [Chitinophagales bacterium]
MLKVRVYIKEAYEELLHKVTWPSWPELQHSAVLVLIASIIISLVVLAMDQASNNVLKLVYQAIAG